MALPKQAETERLLALRKIVEATPTEDVMRWPDPTKEDYTAFGEFMWLFTGIDFLERMIAEVMDDKGMLQAPYKGKARSLSIAKTAAAISSSPIWSGCNSGALARVDEIRKIRNLIAHFIAKRFLEEDALIFMTKSAADFEQVYGEAPGPNSSLYGVIEAEKIYGVLPELRGLLKWMSRLPGELSKGA